MVQVERIERPAFGLQDRISNREMRVIHREHRFAPPVLEKLGG
jgi:hypothetical protein